MDDGCQIHLEVYSVKFAFRLVFFDVFQEDLDYFRRQGRFLFFFEDPVDDGIFMADV